MVEHELDTCWCGDYRKDHAGGTGGCIFTPDPDHPSDGHSGAGRCDSFRLATSYPVEQLQAALKAIIAEPHGCVFCDSGKLRNPKKDHDPRCGFALARAAAVVNRE